MCRPPPLHWRQMNACGSPVLSYSQYIVHASILMSVSVQSAIWVRPCLPRAWARCAKLGAWCIAGCLVRGWASPVRQRFLGLSSLLAGEAWWLSQLWGRGSHSHSRGDWRQNWDVSWTPALCGSLTAYSVWQRQCIPLGKCDEVSGSHRERSVWRWRGAEREIERWRPRGQEFSLHLDGSGSHGSIFSTSKRVRFTGPRLSEPALHCMCVSLPVSDGEAVQRMGPKIGTCIH